MKDVLKKFFRIGFLLSLVTLLLTVFPSDRFSILAGSTVISGGNILEGVNSTNRETSFHDPVSASDGNKVDINVRVVNQGTEDAQNVRVKFNLSNATAPMVEITSDNAGAVSDSVTLTPGGSSLDFVSGSGIKYGPGCSSGCSVGNEVVSTGISLGTVSPSEANSFQVGVQFVVKGTPGGGGKPVFRGGDVFDGGNRSQNLGSWGDPISANPGDAIEFRTQVINDGNTKSDNVSVRVELPTADVLSLSPKSFISGTNAETISDIATVNVSGSTGQKLVYLPGHTRKFGPGCNSGCNLPDGITVHGVTVGTVDPGVTNSFQIAFKAYVSNQQPQTHKACVNMACATVSGGGSDSCSIDSQCYRFACQNNACTKLDGGGSSTCSSNSDCTVQTHKECRNNACTVVSGAGSNACGVDGDCTAANHYECRSSACVLVSGAGASTCSSSSQCQSASQRAICDGLSVNQNSGTAPLYVNSTLSGHTENGGSVVSYKFNFGDGTGDFSQSGNALGHTFNSVGTYVISGIVTDNLGNQAGGSICQKVITVGAVLGVSTPPSAIPKTGPETAALIGLFGSGTIGWLLRKLGIQR